MHLPKKFLWVYSEYIIIFLIHKQITSSSSPVVTTILSGSGTMGSKCGSNSSSAPAPPDSSPALLSLCDLSPESLPDFCGTTNSCCPAPSHLKSGFSKTKCWP